MGDANDKVWRELCSAASEEQDSEKLGALVERIIEAFDDRQRPSNPNRLEPEDRPRSS